MTVKHGELYERGPTPSIGMKSFIQGNENTMILTCRKRV